ncbi:PriCT-2 domain-containing protein [Paraburkholderia gardini]|uniref:DNA primase/helicase n=1 Tax=Paraburkholderia gardini TaxID=2823469 RepID=A0ABN7QNY1_9BURK|nr:PriCT-2 domain-containing protein [Paraburkholderia gardini]CAG4913587.1 hypothetical protein R54767_04016 [Paraburkholderia gardini]
MNAPYVDETNRVRAALAVIPADDYATWVDMAFAVRQGLGDAGFEIWDEWSRSAHNYNERAARTTWRSARASGGKTLASLFWLAQQHGFDVKASRVPGTGTAASSGPDREELARRAREAAREEARVRLRHAAVAQTAVSIWEWARPVAPEHPYLVRKQLEPVATLRELEALELKALLGYTPVSEEEPLAGRVLIVPAWVGDAMTTLELIDGTGRKSSLAGGAKKGGYWMSGVSGTLTADAGGMPILIAEGAATALSAHRATGWVAVAALSAGNLPQVAVGLRERYPRAPLIVLGEPGKAESFARQAAQAAQASLALPSFAQDVRINGTQPTDFNDMAVLSGLDAVGELLRDVASRINTDDPAVTGTPPGADAGWVACGTAIEWLEDTDMRRVIEELTDAMTDEAAGTKRRRTGRRQQTQDAHEPAARSEAGASGVPQQDAGHAGADTDSGPASGPVAQDAHAAGHPGEERSRTAPRREIGQALYGLEDVPGEIRALAQHRFGAQIRMATPRENGGPYRGEVLNAEHYVIQEVATRSVVFHRKDRMEFVSDRLKWMDQNQRMNGAEVQIGYDGDRPKVYPWDRAREQLERVVTSLKKSAREAGFGADLDPTLEQLQSVSWTRFREARAAALAQARERAGREPGGNHDR